MVDLGKYSRAPKWSQITRVQVDLDDQRSPESEKTWTTVTIAPAVELNRIVFSAKAPVNPLDNQIRCDSL